MDAYSPVTDPAPKSPMVVGVLLNDPALLARLDAAFHAAPYGTPPRAPVLYLKPANTHAAEGASVRIPADPGVVQVNATIGLVLARRATRVSVGDARGYLAGYRIVGDLCLPHASVYRPAIRQTCRDGFLPMGAVVPASPGFDPASAEAITFVNGVPVHRRQFAALVRPAAQLLADVSAFMTLEAGDVLLLGAADGAPLARAGDAVRIEVAGLGRLSFGVARETEQTDTGAGA